MELPLLGLEKVMNRKESSDQDNGLRVVAYIDEILIATMEFIQ